MAFSTVRRISLFFVILFSIIVLGIAGSIKDGLGIAAGVISLITVAPALLLEQSERPAVINHSIVEIVWMGVLWVLWLASAALGTKSSGGCSTWYHWYPGVYWSYDASYCNKFHVIQAFGFVNWFILIVLFIWNLKIAISAHSLGHTHVWKMPAAHYDPRYPYGNSGSMTHNKEEPMESA